MKIKEFTLGKTYNTGNYQSVRMDVTVEITPGDCLEAVKVKLENKLDRLVKLNASEIDKARKVVDNPDSYTGAQVKNAQALLDDLEGVI